LRLESAESNKENLPKEVGESKVILVFDQP